MVHLFFFFLTLRTGTAGEEITDLRLFVCSFRGGPVRLTGRLNPVSNPSVEDSELSTVVSFRIRVRQNIALHASSAARNSTCLMSASSVHSASFPPSVIAT